MNQKQSLLLFLYSDGNIVGAVLGILTLLTFFVLSLVGFGGLAFSLLFIALAVLLYAGGVMLTPKSPTLELRIRNQVTKEEIERGLDNLIKSIRGKVSDDILAIVESIRGSIQEILPYIVDIGSGDHDIYTIRKTALDYLPETLENYLSLPRAFANVHPVKEGKTAKQLLVEQLTLLDQEMEEISEDFHSNNMNKLLAHGRFLETKFKKADLGIAEIG